MLSRTLARLYEPHSEGLHNSIQSVVKLVLLAVIGGTGCKVPAPPLSSAPVHQGIFLVAPQAAKQPTVEVDNNSDAPLRMLMNAQDGKLYTLDVAARESGEIDVPTGHYEAKVVDVRGEIKSAYGSADITEYKRYTASFVVQPGGGHTFHIGK